MPCPDPPLTGAHLIAASLRSLGVTIVFGIVGIPVIEVADALLAHGIRFVSFRNEQAASYAASCFGYLTGKPGVCLVVGGPGVIHALAGVTNSMVNATYPMLLLAGSSETTAEATKGAFQQMDQVAFMAPHTKVSMRAPDLRHLPGYLRDAYQTAMTGRPGAAYMDLPADQIQASLKSPSAIDSSTKLSGLVRLPADVKLVSAIANALLNAERPLVIVGKGAAYARAEVALNKFINLHQVPFLPTPQGKGVMPDSSPLNASTARTVALKGADFILILGARINWILHFGTRFARDAKIAQVDIDPEELGRNGISSELSVPGDITVVLSQLLSAPELNGFKHPSDSKWRLSLLNATQKNKESAALKDSSPTPADSKITYHRAFALIRNTLNALTKTTSIVYVSEGANTMDISRSSFHLDLPRQKLDAGTYATMGVGLGYAIAAHTVYAPSKRIVCLEGDSALGFSLAEIETMARYRMDVIIFVMNNGGVYHGISEDNDSDRERWDFDGRRNDVMLPATALGFETEYHKVAEGLGGKGWVVRSEQELEIAVGEAWEYRTGPSLVNILMKSGKGAKLEFGWMESTAGQMPATTSKL